MDFETAQPALPRYPGTSPFQALPFQFSCHIQRAPGVAPEHTDFLATADTDPRRPLAEALLNALGDRGSIVVYSSFERRVLGELADALPDLAEPLAALQDRLWDLLRVVRD
ncbi:DUF2779 domain-containing protein [Halorhodospira halophila]|uniref:DUF2779 domain-containing protein n=1 Tax=Halorhodospira halophila TaxID=1053 RepID=UPI0009D723A9|nr:DUF2779 domain-containing protein [Halorhodospira halophila]MBK1730182.1 DUF2779 domain-containing protein [Halorhodospira halophila]